MERKHYLYLITETYFETKNPVASEPAEPMFDLQEKLFKQILIRKQKVAEREDFITKDEFLLQCELALIHLKEYVDLQSLFEINRLHEKKESTRTFWFDENGSIQDIPESVVKDSINRVQIEIDNFDQNSFLVDLSELNPAICGKLCNYEIEFLEDIFKNFNIEIDQSKQHEPLDLSDITKSTHRISENPFVIDLVKNYFDLRLESQRFDIDLKQSFKMFLIRKQKSLKQTDFISKKEFFSKFKAYVNSLGHSIISIQNELEEIEDFKDNVGLSLETFWKHKGKFRNEILKMEDVNLIIEIISELLLKSNQPQQTKNGIMASNKIEEAINKVLKGEWTTFDFITCFKKVSTADEMEVFFSELDEAFQLFELSYYSPPCSYIDDDGKVIEEVKKHYSPFCVEEFESVYNYYKKQYKQTKNLDLADTSTFVKTSFENKFDDVQEIKIIEYFTKNLVDKKYITNEVLNEYLKQAFELRTPPTQRFSFEKLTTQAKIKKVFYEYFRTTAGKPNGRKKEYVELLGEYFTGFNTAKLMTNFSK